MSERQQKRRIASEEDKKSSSSSACPAVLLYKRGAQVSEDLVDATLSVHCAKQKLIGNGVMPNCCDFGPERKKLHPVFFSVHLAKIGRTGHWRISVQSNQAHVTNVWQDIPVF